MKVTLKIGSLLSLAGPSSADDSNSVLILLGVDDQQNVGARTHCQRFEA